MLKEKRQETIINLVNKEKFVSMQTLKEVLESSESTIRNDLAELEKEKKLIRLHGGAQTINEFSEGSYGLDKFSAKELKEKEAKIKIGKYAANLIKDGMIVYIDAGTSTKILAEFIEAADVTFITNSVVVAKPLRLKGFKVYVVGGELKVTTDALIGPLALELLRKWKFDIGFFGTNGVSVNHGLTTPDYEEAIIKDFAIERCKEVYVLADHTKFDVEKGIMFHDLKNVTIITDRVIRKEFLEYDVIQLEPNNEL